MIDNKTRHDLNNYLSAIVTYADLLLEENKLEDKHRKFVSMIATSGKHAQKLVNATDTLVPVKKSGIGTINLTPTGKILVVDDQPDMREMIAAVLDNVGYEAVLCADGETAIRKLRDSQGEFILAIVDQSMPVMTGDQLATQIAGAYVGIPVILVTGHNLGTLPTYIKENASISAIVEKSGLLLQLPDAIKAALGSAF